MLRIENLRKNYKSFSLDCTMEVRPGCVTGLIGQNGAGKSTTFKAALGLISTGFPCLGVGRKSPTRTSIQGSPRTAAISALWAGISGNSV